MGSLALIGEGEVVSKKGAKPPSFSFLPLSLKERGTQGVRLINNLIMSHLHHGNTEGYNKAQNDTVAPSGDSREECE
jgi:hypothetical protein